MQQCELGREGHDRTLITILIPPQSGTRLYRRPGAGRKVRVRTQGAGPRAYASTYCGGASSSSRCSSCCSRSRKISSCSIATWLRSVDTPVAVEAAPGERARAGASGGIGGIGIAFSFGHADGGWIGAGAGTGGGSDGAREGDIEGAWRGGGGDAIGPEPAPLVEEDATELGARVCM